MSDFITDVERQYELYCKIAEEHGFIDLNAKKNDFRCTTKSNEFNTGWIAFVGAVAAVRDEQQAIINNLKAQLNNMETCYIEKKKEVEACAALVGQWREKRMGGCSDYARGGLHSRQDCADDLEKALRGANDLLTDARQKAEDQINNGARLTKHQIDL